MECGRSGRPTEAVTERGDVDKGLVKNSIMKNKNGTIDVSFNRVRRPANGRRIWNGGHMK